jgi:hypothetical protein
MSEKRRTDKRRRKTLKPLDYEKEEDSERESEDNAVLQQIPQKMELRRAKPKKARSNVLLSFVY